ncbi:C3HC4 type (RING finger) domain-containing protein [Hexamita inflata]|uniref:C3HC4 type (RING finger) domain-containing protein n=1 Tax=Hexamita inflata TaxID=28002 RepID=A0AA86UTZ9_9EUKA|nr:C3HC4 type (RING finger) domain-containing protein [Hexamita inflata]
MFRFCFTQPTRINSQQKRKLSIAKPQYQQLIDQQSGNESFQCPICYDQYNYPVALPCGHVMCYQCIKQWGKQLNECPVCRQNFQAEELIRLIIGKQIGTDKRPKPQNYAKMYTKQSIQFKSVLELVDSQNQQIVNDNNEIIKYKNKLQNYKVGLCICLAVLIIVLSQV